MRFSNDVKTFIKCGGFQTRRTELAVLLEVTTVRNDELVKAVEAWIPLSQIREYHFNPRERSFTAEIAEWILEQKSILGQMIKPKSGAPVPANRMPAAQDDFDDDIPF